MSGINPQYNPLRADYWFGEVDSRPLGLFRIIFALLLLKDAVYRFWTVHWFISDAGLFPLETMHVMMTRHYFTLLEALPEPWMVYGFLTLWVVVLLMLLLGYRTRLMTILNLIIIVSVHERNVYVLNGADTVLRVLSFWAIWLPLGRAYSLDALRERWRRFGRSHHPADLRAPQTPPTAFALPLRLIQLQVAMVYVFTFILKLPGDAWQRGEAVYWALQLKSLTLPTGDFILNHAPLWVFKILSYQALVAEGLFLFLVFLPVMQPLLRGIGLSLTGMMHVGIAFLMSIPNFSTIMLASYILFFDPVWIDWLEDRFKRMRAPSLIDPPAPDSPLWVLLALTQGDAIRLRREEPRLNMGSGYDGWWTAGEDVEPVTGAGAWLRAVGHLPTSRLWAWILRAEFVRRAVWAILCRRIRQLNPPTPDSTAQPLGPQSRPPWQIAVGRILVSLPLLAMFSVLVWWNLTTIDKADGNSLVGRVSEPARSFVQYLGVWQAWNMFSPYPSTVDGWVVIPGVFEDGTEIDLREGGPVELEFRRYYAGPNSRWKKFESNMRRRAPEAMLTAWARYYCRSYGDEGGYAPGERLATLEIHFYHYRSHAPGEPPNELEDQMLWKHWCYPQYEY